MRNMMLLVVLLALALSAAHADLNFGSYAKAVAMGGAGLAVIDDPLASGAVNPAAYAVKSPRFRLMFPSLDYRFEGTSLGQLMDLSNEVSNTSGDSAVTLAQKLGKQNTNVELDGLMGFSLGPVVVTADGQANVGLVPSAAFKSWANNPNAIDWAPYVNGDGTANLAALQNAFTAQVNGQLVTSLPSVAMGFKVPKHERMNVGIRAKLLHSTVKQQTVVPSADTTASLTGGVPSVTLGLDTSDITTVEDTGFGMDVGFIYQTPDPRAQVTTALVVNNLVKPNLNQVSMDRMVSAGASVRMSNKLLVAADLVNITESYNKGMQVRLGAELRPVRWFSVRAGYGGNNITYGVGVLGFDLALAKQNPLVIGRIWKF